ncbi:MAG: hypothetical protein J6Q01_05905 [Alistipes sp.]|nr:hypothetical protein [Alistipes sp.]
MKRLFIALSVLFAAVACAPNEGGDPHKTYEIGDLYKVGGVEGVVIALEEDAHHGTIVGLTEPDEELIWESANRWCNSQGEGWYAPSIEELGRVYGVREILASLGAGLHASFYWSCEENGPDYGRYVNMQNGNDNHGTKGMPCWARAVRKF